MKRRALLRKLAAAGYALSRSKGPHDVYTKQGGPSIAVPRHVEIAEPLARKILRDGGIS